MTASTARLARTALPNHYELTFEPDLLAGVFTGRAVIDLDVTAPLDTLLCNAAELSILDAAVVQHGTRRALGVELIEADEQLKLSSAVPIEAGPAQLELRFSGSLTDRLVGFYRSTFRSPDGAEHALAATQFEATHARRAFPCWDEPEFKATYGITLVIDPELTAVSNARTVSDSATPDGRRAVTFARTMKMSTYLVAFVVGPLAQSRTVDAGGTSLSVLCRPDRLPLAELALDAGAFCLRYFADYFDIAYPGDKLDLVAIPDFAFGAMENLGCVTFRETALLVDPAKATQPELQRVVDVIAHELAHMWFGDLVTMRWWNGLWLNEAFATFMEMKATDAYRPEWQRWTDFGLSRTAAFDVDSLSSTRPIEFEVHSPNDAEAMFDVLTYEKGAAVVRMLEQFVGEDSFRRGMRAYMAKHAYGSTDTADLWDAIEAATELPVRSMMDSWILQGGYPLVDVEATEGGYVLRQSRFAFGEGADATRWTVPVRLRESGGSEIKALLNSSELAVTGGPIVTANAEGAGFYRARLPQPLLAQLDLDQLSAIERYGLLDDEWASTLAGRSSAADYFALLFRFGADGDLSVWQRIAAALGALERVVADDRRALFAAKVCALVRPKFLELDGAAGLDDRGTQLRATLFGVLGKSGDDRDVVARARDIFRDGHPDPALVAAAISITAADATADEHRVLRERLAAATSPQDEERYRYALVETPLAVDFDRSLAMCTDGTIRTQDAPYVVARALQNRRLGARAWDFVATRWTELNDLYPSMSIPRMISGIVALAEPQTAAAIEQFFAEHSVPHAQRQVDQHLERLAVAAAFRARERVPFGASL